MFFFSPVVQKKEKKKMEILALATIWMNLEDIMLNEISQSQKGRYCIIPFTCGISRCHKDQANLQRKKVDQWLPGAKKRKNRQ